MRTRHPHPWPRVWAAAAGEPSYASPRSAPRTCAQPGRGARGTRSPESRTGVENREPGASRRCRCRCRAGLPPALRSACHSPLLPRSSWPLPPPRFLQPASTCFFKVYIANYGKVSKTARGTPVCHLLKIPVFFCRFGHALTSVRRPFSHSPGLWKDLSQPSVEGSALAGMGN